MLFLAAMASKRVVVFPSSAELGPVLAQLVCDRAQKALSAGRSQFSLGLSGGSLVSMLSKELPAQPGLDCSKWVVGFCDERVVPFDDPESTYGLYKVCALIILFTEFFIFRNIGNLSQHLFITPFKQMFIIV